MSVKKQTALQDIIANLPSEPGIYQYFDAENTLIYVGKAKNIKKRVSSYFSKIHTDGKTRRLVSQIRNIEIIVVGSEFDAYLLENNLIKERQPKYNINLKDDKTYPHLVITNERFPRIFSTRKIEKGKGTYFGPYTSVKAMHTVLEVIKKVYSIRNCSLVLTEKSVQQGKYKVCLEYHIGNCKGPCEALQEEGDYLQDIEQIKHVLMGDIRLAVAHLENQMKDFAQNLAFEKAQKAKQKLELLDRFQSSSLIVHPTLGDLEVFTISSEEDVSYINHLSIAFGRVIYGKTQEFRRKLDETDSEILAMYIVFALQERGKLASEILLNLEVDLHIESMHFIVPKIGDKKKLVDLSLRNTIFFKKDRLERVESKALEDRHQRVMETLQRELNLKELPDHIECFDNSNIQGTTPVAAMVCYKNGQPSKKDWRHFNIKTVVGPDDFASMREIVARRYKRLVAEEQPLPKLIIIDGGKGQLSSAVEAMKEAGVYGKIAVIGIAKRLEEIYVPGDDLPLFLSKKSEGLKLIQKMRDDTHRFGITFHRDQRSRKLDLDQKAKQINKKKKSS